jgi:hypothetical protein
MPLTCASNDVTIIERTKNIMAMQVRAINNNYKFWEN